MRDKLQFLQEHGWLLTLGLLLATVVSLWLPFGLRTVGLIEEYLFYSAFDRRDSLFTTPLLLSQRDRPFVILTLAVGYLLTPESFVGLNAELALLFLGKAVVLYALLRRLLPENPAFCLAAAILYILYPADIALFELRAIAYHAHAFFYLLSVYFLIVFWQRPGLVSLIGMWLSLFICVGTYELAYPLILTTPLLLILFERRIDKKVVNVASLWYCVPLVSLFWTICIITLPGTYQGNLTLFPNAPGGFLANAFQKLSLAYLRNFVGGWIEALLHLDTTPLFVFMALLITIGVGLVMWFYTRMPTQAVKTSNVRRYIVVFIIGLGIISLGYLAIMPFDQNVQNERVFLLSSAGTALSLTSLVFLISRLFPWPRTVFVATASAIVGLAVLGALNRHLDTFKLSLANQRILAGIVSQVPELHKGTVLLLFDEAEQLRQSQWTFAVEYVGYHLTEALKYVYADPSVEIWLCYPDDGIWGYSQEGCVLKKDEVELIFGGTKHASYSYDKVIAVNYRATGDIVLMDRIPKMYIPDFDVQNYNPHALIDPDAAPPRRVHTLFTAWPLDLTSKPRIPQENVNIVFDQPILGRGWSWLEPNRRWTRNRTATISLLLAQGHDYEITFRVISGITQDVLDSLRLNINDQPIELTYIPDQAGARIYRGLIPQKVIAADQDNTTLTFQTNQVVMYENIRPLGVAFEWLRATPLNKP